MSCSSDSSIRYWNVQSSVEKWKIEKTHKAKSVFCIDISSSNLSFASGGADFYIRLWEMQTQINTHKLKGHSDDIVFA